MNVLMLLTSKEDVAYIYDTYTLRQGLEKMRAHGYTAIPVLSEDGKYVGCVSEGDFLWHMLDHGEYDMKTQEHYDVQSIIREGFMPAVRIDVSMDKLLDKVLNQNFVPVTDDRGFFIGIVTRKDIILHYIQPDK